MSTYYLVKRNENFAIIVDPATDTVLEYCGPIDSSDMPAPGSSIDLRTWNYDPGDYEELTPWHPEVAILAMQEAADDNATWFIETDEDEYDH